MITQIKSAIKKLWTCKNLIDQNTPKKTSKLPSLINGLPNWGSAPISGMHKDLRNDSQLILIPTCVGGFTPGLVIESMLGVALTARKANVHYLLCDSAMPACLQVHIGKVGGAQVLVDDRLKEVACTSCFGRGRQVLDSTDLPVTYYSNYITPDRRNELKILADTILIDKLYDYHIGSCNVGEHAKAGALRFFSSGHLPESREGEIVLRRYFEAALISYEVISSVLIKLRPDCAVFNHGIYVPHGVIGDVARANGIRVVNWNVAYKKKTFIFSHGDTYHHTLIDEPNENWENIKLSEQMNNDLMHYLHSRRYGTEDWIWFHDQPRQDMSLIAAEAGINMNKPIVSALTNVFWDAQLHFKTNAFTDMLEWLLQTIEYYITRPDIQLIIRIHPAEVRGSIPSRQPIEGEIKKVYPNLPANIFVIPAESQACTYTICEHSDAVIIYGTKTGIELAAYGIPVIVAGEAWVRNKGITNDANSKETYYNILENIALGDRVTGEQHERAKKYAYHIFFRRFIPLHCIDESTRSPPFEVTLDSLDDLMPGRDLGLDVICNGILSGSEFIYPAENLAGEHQ